MFTVYYYIYGIIP